MSILDSVIGGLMGGGQQQPSQGGIGGLLTSLVGGGGMGGGMGSSMGSSGGMFGNPGAMPGMMGSGGGTGGMGLGQGLAAAGGLAGLASLLGRFQNAGLGQQAQSWVSNGPNQQVSPDQLQSVFGDGEIQQMSQQTGLPRQDLLGQLSQHLPELVNRLTPNGQLPGGQTFRT